MHTKAGSKIHPMVFVYLVMNEVSKDPVRTVQRGRKIRMPEQGKVTEVIPPDKRANVLFPSPYS